jgi:signal transduction histidine kinase
VRAIARFGGAVYVATFGRGLERFDGPGRRTLVWPRQGDDERGREVVSLFADGERGRLWVGTANAGVFYFDGRGVKTEPALAPSGASTVWGAGVADGWLWLATSRGLYAFREGRALTRSCARPTAALAAARLQLASEAESERRRIARDLHDQTLADLRRLLLLTDEMQPGGLPAGTTGAATGTTGGASGASGGALQTAATVFDPAALRAEIEAISQEVRRICEDLSPSVLENVGFPAALEFALASALAHLPAERKFAYDFSCDEDLEERLALARGVQMQVYRIVQEVVSNVCRHADAARVSLAVRLDDAGEFTLTLEDDGRGFDAGNRKAQRGRGLAGIRARASLIEAEVEWRRREGGGTLFVLRKKSAGKKGPPNAER